MEHDTDSNLTAPPYSFYQHEDSQYSGMPYTQPHLPYQVVPNAQARASEMLQMRGLSLMSHQPYSPQSAVYPASSTGIPVSPTRVAASMQLPPSPSPATDPTPYDHPISPPVSGSDTSNDSHTHYQHTYSRESSSGAGSPPSGFRGSSLVHRSQHRYHPAPTLPLKSRRRRSSTNDEHDFSDDGDQDGSGIGISPQSTGGGLSGHHLAESLANSRKEATRRQRIEAEQRRRDELREGYAKLKDVLPLSNQKSSKVSLLERATNYITSLDQTSKIVHARLAALETEVARLREINERLSLTVMHHTGHMPTDIELGIPPDHMIEPNLDRPLSPPPDIHPSQPPSHQHAPPQSAQQQQSQQEPQYRNRADSSASGSQASGSEY